MYPSFHLRACSSNQTVVLALRKDAVTVTTSTQRVLLQLPLNESLIFEAVQRLSRSTFIAEYSTMLHLLIQRVWPDWLRTVSCDDSTSTWLDITL